MIAIIRERLAVAKPITCATILRDVILGPPVVR
jgi:hypothetical protein